ncbi:dipeptide/oligopeptide/nickel ABC transporter permease/ATP-binding protein [Rhodospirillaceae bacterium SYSU D60014]|uniref:dipeptide/oligopeptide/nickel ABC transporter permease/ATP-binding protein n=1 Tax=Virgifigura deserti TaxID=2268457 RepID=UPI000E65F4AE
MTSLALDETGDAPPRSRPSAWNRLSRNALATFGLVLVVAIAAIAAAAPLLPLADPNATDVANRLQPVFSDGHWLGTDQLGRDILSRLIWGTRVSLAVGIAATLVATAIGALIGLVAAYYGRWTDTLLMRGIDMLMAFPYLLLALAIVAVLGPGLLNAMVAIALVNIPFFARAVRGATVSLVTREYVDAARLCGMSNPRIIAREIFPNVLPVIVITMSTTLGWMILETAGLSFLGLGAQPPQADLGSMLGDGRKLIVTAPHVATIPGLVILLLVIGTNLLGDGLRDVLDPRLKSGALARPMAVTAVDASAGRPAAGAPNAAEAPLLSVQGLETHFVMGRAVFRAVNGVSFDVAAGEAVGIVGESGSGKSVTALSLLGLVPTPPGRIVGGDIRFRGESLIGAPLSRLQDIRGNRIAYIFQDPLTTLNPLLTVGEQVTEAVRRHQNLDSGRARQWTLELFERVQIPRAKERLASYPHELSGGQRQRVGIAMALANDPDLIIADEPTTALDVTTQAQVLKLLDELRRERGAALIFITHDFGVVSELCDRILVMYAGRVVEEGPVEAVFADPRHPYTRRLMACVPILGEPERSIDAIPGLPPAVNRLPPGCAFAPRCPLVLDACRHGEIPLDRLGDGRAARCIRAQESDQESSDA